jgi:hypothetical protein
MIRKAFNYVVSNFGFEDASDFTTSLLHSKLMLLTLPIAGVSSVIERSFGLQSLTILAFVLLVTLELITGLIAAKVSKVKIESRKFGRFGLKIFIWLSLLFIINALRIEYNGHEDTLGSVAYSLFNWLHGTLFIYVNIEYLISVLENLATISGNKNASIIELIKNKFEALIGKNKNNEENS